MEETTKNVTDTIISTINTIFENIFSSIDNNLYSILDDITFINTDILNDNAFKRIFGTNATNGMLLIANSLLLGILLYYAIKILLANYTFTQVESPGEFIFKLIIFGICMNSSYFIIEQFLSLISNVSLAIRDLGGELFGKNVCFTELINTINGKMSFNVTAVDIFTIDGLMKGVLTVSIFGLVLSYSLRYIMIKVFVLLGPFAFLTLSQNSTAWFFKSWAKNFFSLLFIQIIVAVVLLILLSMNFTTNNILTKFLYLGGVYALIRVNTFVREFIGGISTDIQSNVGNIFKIAK